MMKDYSMKNHSVYAYLTPKSRLTFNPNHLF